ncbi:MAG: hypothetical protein ABIQ32_03600 [Sphingomicrobium sp.]
MERSDLPDLFVRSVHKVGDVAAEFEVVNQGGGAAGRFTLMSCAYAGDKHFCSASQSVAGLAAGASRSVRVDCFYSAERIASAGASGGLFGGMRLPSDSTPPQCDTPVTNDNPAITKYSVHIDSRLRSQADEYFKQTGKAAPAALDRECAEDFGCVRELNEKNNDPLFEAPFP